LHFFSGAIGARLSTDASTIRSLVGDTLALVLQNIATVIAGLVIAFTANWMLAFIILAVLPLVLLQATIQAKFSKGFSADAKVSFLLKLLLQIYEGICVGSINDVVLNHHLSQKLKLIGMENDGDNVISQFISKA
jgi:ABC-type multidrug transport system fused ATPase/permease subunit